MMGLFARAVFMLTQTIPTAEPFLLPGNRTGCLLIHGFTRAPKAAYVPPENVARLQVFEAASQFIQRVELQFR